MIPKRFWYSYSCGENRNTALFTRFPFQVMAKNTAYLHGIFKDVTRVNQFVIDSDRVLHRHNADSNVRTGVDSASCKYKFLMIIHFHIVSLSCGFPNVRKNVVVTFCKNRGFLPGHVGVATSLSSDKVLLLDLMCDILPLYSPKYNSTTEERRQKPQLNNVFRFPLVSNGAEEVDSQSDSKE